MNNINELRQVVIRHISHFPWVKFVLGLSLGVFFAYGVSQAQGVPRVGNRLEFAGVTIHLNEATQHFVQQEAEILYVNRALVTAQLERLNLYIPIIKPFLAQHSLSDDFIFLALYDPAPVTDEPGNGFWALGKSQLPELRINPFVDERLHPVRSTLAAINRLKQLYQQKANWVSAIHRYDLFLRADTTRLLAPETGDNKVYALTNAQDRFLIRLLATKIVLERAMSVYHPSNQTVLFPYEESRGKSIPQIAEQCQATEKRVAQYNTWLKAPRVPDQDDYTVYIPVTLEHYVELKRRTNPADNNPMALQDAGFPALEKIADAPQRGGTFYRINGKKGIQAQLFDSRITLAYQGKLKVKKFEHYNDLRGDRPIVAGEIYYLRKKSKRARVPFHIVKRGQSLWSISQQYGIKLERLIAYNAINPEQQPTPTRVLWLQKKRPRNLPVEYYRSPKSPDSAPSIPKTDPVLVQTRPGVAAPKPQIQPVAPLALPPTVPPSNTLAMLDSMIAALNKPELPVFRSSATKTIHPVRSAKIANPEKLPDEEAEEVSGPLIMHIAEKTDTYATVARQYHVTVQQLYTWNNLSALKPLQPGQLLLIDQSKSPTTKELVPLATKPPAKPIIAKPSVAKPVTAPVPKTVADKPVPPSAPKTAVAKPVTTPSLKTVVAKTLAASTPKPAVAKPPIAKPTQAPAPTYTYSDEIIHVVQAGENMYRIGLRYNVKPTQIQQWNNLPDLTAVIGARLIIRKK
ncbi:hypothetical protein GCM10027347_38560 [Larkinella harenae]